MNDYTLDNRQFGAALAADRGRLVGLCVSITGDLEAAEDLAQETLTEAWQHRGRLHDPAGLSLWTSAIARNICKRWAREKGRRAVESGNVALGETSQPGASVDDHLAFDLERGELVDLLDRAMAQLTPQARAVLVQRYVEDLPYPQIADRLCMSEGAVRVTLHRGKLAMRRVLTDELGADAAAFGITVPDETGWRETGIWCPLCGTRPFMGRLDTTRGEFELRCPQCHTSTGPYARYAWSEGFGRVRGFRSAFNAIQRFVVQFHEAALTSRHAICPGCERATLPLRLSLPPDAQPSARSTRGMHLHCDRCRSDNSMRLSNLVLYQPDAWEFWRRHPRIHLLPERSIEVDNRDAILLSYAVVGGTARLDAVVAADTYDLLRIHRSSGR